MMVEPLIIVVSREEVVYNNITPALNILKKLIESPEKARTYKEKVDITFHGYDNYPEELFEIQEVRNYVYKLDEKFPFWLYFLSKEFLGLQALLFCFLPPFLNDTAKEEILLNQIDALLSNRWFPALNQIGDFVNMSDNENKEITERTIQYILNGPQREKIKETNTRFFDEKEDVGESKYVLSIEAHLSAGIPLIIEKLSNPAIKFGIQIFILGMADMFRQVENLSWKEYVSICKALFKNHNLISSDKVEDFIEQIIHEVRTNHDVAKIMEYGAQSIEMYIAKNDANAPMDILSVAKFAEKHAKKLTEFNYEVNEYISNEMLIDHDWSSTAVWVRVKDGGWANSDYDDYPLSEELIQRMRYWCDWHDSYEPHLITTEMKWDAWNAYGYALAIDAKRELGSDYKIYFSNNEEIEIHL